MPINDTEQGPIDAQARQILNAVASGELPTYAHGELVLVRTSVKRLLERLDELEKPPLTPSAASEDFFRGIQKRMQSLAPVPPSIANWCMKVGYCAGRASTAAENHNYVDMFRFLETAGSALLQWYIHFSTHKTNDATPDQEEGLS